jgi:hypothetical protein
MITVPADDKYIFESEQIITVRKLAEHLVQSGDYPDIIDNSSKYVMMWYYNNKSKNT